MFKRLKNWLKKKRQEKIVQSINKALGITLYDWQIDYIFGANIIISGMSSGRTLAMVLKTLLNVNNVVDCRNVPTQNSIKLYNSVFKYKRWLKKYYVDIYEKLKNNTNLPLCKLLK
jgi:hypothetical protein